MLYGFIVVSLALLVICLLILLRPLFRKDMPAVSSNSEELVTVYRDKLSRLKRQLDDDEIDNEQYRLARQELETALASELPADEKAGGRTHRHPRTGWTIAIIFPVVAILLYLVLGNPAALTGESLTAQTTHQGSQPPVEDMVVELEQKLADDPGNLQGWLLLGRSYTALGNPEKSNHAYAQALKLAPDDPGVVLDYAESIARSQHNMLSGEPEQLIDRALQLDPDSVRGRVLKGIAYYQKGEADNALAIWNPMYLDSTFSQERRELIGQLIESAGGTLPDTGLAASASVKVHVKLDKDMQQYVDPDDTLFIYARAESGPPMPLAIVRKRASDLPVTVELNDSQAMMPKMKLSLFDHVVVTARVSKVGSATPSSGDIEGASGALKPKENPSVEIVIDHVIP